MTVVLVHGNPETEAVWCPLVERLPDREVVRLSPPGFGAPVPDGFAAAMDGHRDWLVSELEQLRADGREPVDLVGHDWGGGHVVNVAMVRPDLLRSWASDIVGVFDEDYVWHDLAQLWQSGDGEQAVAQMMGAPAADKVRRLAEFGMGAEVAERVAAGMDAAMGDCVLTLYRSAAQPTLARRGADLERAAVRPGPACRCWPPRTTWSAPTRSAGVPPSGPAPAPTSSTAWGTGG